MPRDIITLQVGQCGNQGMLNLYWVGYTYISRLACLDKLVFDRLACHDRLVKDSHSSDMCECKEQNVYPNSVYSMCQAMQHLSFTLSLLRL